MHGRSAADRIRAGIVQSIENNPRLLSLGCRLRLAALAPDQRNGFLSPIHRPSGRVMCYGRSMKTFVWSLLISVPKCSSCPAHGTDGFHCKRCKPSRLRKRCRFSPTPTARSRRRSQPLRAHQASAGIRLSTVDRFVREPIAGRRRCAGGAHRFGRQLTYADIVLATSLTFLLKLPAVAFKSDRHPRLEALRAPCEELRSSAIEQPLDTAVVAGRLAACRNH
jgi:hypothetical protein